MQTLETTETIARAITTVNDRIKSLSADKLRSLETNATIDITETIAYQNLQSRSFASGIINQVDATWLYRMLQGFNKRPLADRIVTLELISMLAKV